MNSSYNLNMRGVDVSLANVEVQYRDQEMIQAQREAIESLRREDSLSAVAKQVRRKNLMRWLEQKDILQPASHPGR